MQITDKIKESLGSWWFWMQELVESEIWDNLYRQLKIDAQKGKIIIPKSPDTWKSLRLCNKDKVKAIILLQCPYATMRNEVMIADGIPMSCANIAPYQQPNLYQWHWAIEDQYGFSVDHDQRCDISYLLEEEHVLLLNTSLTVEKDKVDSHALIWHPVMKWFIENVINRYLNGIPVVLVGTQAQKFEQYLNPLANPIKKVEHPAAASYANRDWRHEKMHLWINEVIKQNNGEGEMIRWVRNKGEGKKIDVQEDLPEWVTEKVELPKAQDIGLPWKD